MLFIYIMVVRAYFTRSVHFMIGDSTHCSNILTLYCSCLLSAFITINTPKSSKSIINYFFSERIRP